MRSTWKLLVLCGVLTSILASTVVAEEEDKRDSLGVWYKELTFDFLATQTSYSNDWVGGEAGSFSWQTDLFGNVERRVTETFRYRTELRLKFGQTMTQNAETKDWARPQKSTDLIDWENVGTFTLGWIVDPYVAFRLESQFFDGRNANKKLWLSPMQLTESTGGSHRFYAKKDDHVTSRLGVAAKQIFRTSIVDNVTLATEDSTFVSGGIESVTDAVLSFHKNIRYVSKLSLFKALFFSEKDNVAGTPQEDDWKAVDINWENAMIVSVMKYVTVTLYTQLLYDKEIVDKGRFKQTLALGLVYKLWQ